MGKLIPIAVTLAILAASKGLLPSIVRHVRMAQIKLLNDSQASKWAKPWTPVSK